MSPVLAYLRFTKMQRDCKVIKLGAPAIEEEWAFHETYPELLTALAKAAGWLPHLHPCCDDGALIAAARDCVRMLRTRKIHRHAVIGEGAAVREAIARARAAAWN